MGNPVSPILANLTLAMAECNVFTTEMITKVKIYRYLDDIVAFVDNSFLDTYPIEFWEKYKNCFYSWMEIYEKSFNKDNKLELIDTGCINTVGDKVSFLDLSLSWEIIDNQKMLIIENYNKPMNKHIYTDPSTFYPSKYIYNWIHGENIRLIRNCDKESDYDRHVNDFIDYLKRRNYSDNIIKKQLAITNYKDKKSWMTKKEKKEENNNYIMIENDENRTIMTEP